MKTSRLFILFAAGVSALASCDRTGIDPTDLDAKETTFKEIITPYVNNTVIPTYKGMADNAVLLAEACASIQEKHSAGTLATADIKAACDAWLACRDYWEKSEAFLYGPAGDYNIDPHIDSWPLDKVQMETLLKNISAGQTWDAGTLGVGLLGFHATEYMIFELNAAGDKSQTHSTTYSAAELEYLCGVADDLRDQCVYLYACWAGLDNVSSEFASILEAAELEPTADGYGWQMVNAGQAGSIYKTYQAAVETLVQGCIDIADEVGNTKIGTPNKAASAGSADAVEAAKNYIESPYSLNSIVDFVGNIISIRSCYEGSKAGDASVSDYVKTIDADLDAKVKALIEESMDIIGSIPEPFAANATCEAANNAVIKVGTELVEALEEVYTTISE